MPKRSSMVGCLVAGLGGAHAADAARDDEVLPRSQTVVETGILGEHAGAPAHLVAFACRIEPEHAARAPVRSEHAVEETDGCRLPGAVGSEDGQHLARLRVERQSVEGNLAVERAGQAVGDDGRLDTAAIRIHRISLTFAYGRRRCRKSGNPSRISMTRARTSDGPVDTALSEPGGVDPSAADAAAAVDSGDPLELGASVRAGGAGVVGAAGGAGAFVFGAAVGGGRAAAGAGAAVGLGVVGGAAGAGVVGGAVGAGVGGGGGGAAVVGGGGGGGGGGAGVDLTPRKR